MNKKNLAWLPYNSLMHLTNIACVCVYVCKSIKPATSFAASSTSVATTNTTITVTGTTRFQIWNETNWN